MLIFDVKILTVCENDLHFLCFVTYEKHSSKYLLSGWFPPAAPMTEHDRLRVEPSNHQQSGGFVVKIPTNPVHKLKIKQRILIATKSPSLHVEQLSHEWKH